MSLQPMNSGILQTPVSTLIESWRGFVPCVSPSFFCKAFRNEGVFLPAVRFAPVWTLRCIALNWPDTAMRTMPILILSVTIGLLSSCALAWGAGDPTGTVQGVVFTVGADAAHLAVPATEVSLEGPVHIVVKSNGEGQFRFNSVPSGSYKISAHATGMGATQTVQVRAGSVSEVDVQMILDAVQQSDVVTANAEPASIKDPSGRNTIGESEVRNMPNIDERFQTLLPLIPGVVRGPNGLIDMKGARASQNGALINNADVTDPATGSSTINIPIDVVSSLQVFSTPYDPEYGNFVGAVSNLETRLGDFKKFRISVQNLLPRLRKLDGSIMGIAEATPRLTISGPIVKDRVAVTQSFEYRYERDPVDSLPHLQRWTRSENFNSYTQLDFNISQKQTATASFAIFPQKLDYYGLNTFTPQPSTPNLHERGYEASLQHRYVTNSADLLTSQVSFTKFDADVLPNSGSAYELHVETTKGGFFDRQRRRTTRIDWEEVFHSHPYHLFGSHELDAGFEFAHSTYDGRLEFLPVQIFGVAGYPLERIQFGPSAHFSIGQNETTWFIGDKWSASGRLAFDLGLRFDYDSVTGSLNTAPRAGFVLALTRDNKTVLKGGAGLFYDRVPLDIPAFRYLPPRTVTALDAQGGTLNSTRYSNIVPDGLSNPRSEVWNLELDRAVGSDFLLRVAYQQRNTVHEYFVNPISYGSTGNLNLSDRGSEIYREFQIAGRYQIHHSTLNISYVHSRAFGDLNDFDQFFGNDPQPVIQPNQRGRLNFDAPNRVLAWGEIALPWKLIASPVFDAHTGFPYSTIHQNRQFIGPRNHLRFPRFVSTDIQVWREIPLPIEKMHARIGFGAFNVFNRPNYRDVQDDLDSDRYGEFFNGVGRMYHAKFVLEF